ncbi:Imm50 family immunity protein [Streptomyces anulatus]
MTSHWADLTVNSHRLGSLYSVIPSLESVRLRSFHLNWRGPALTLRIDLPSYPEHVPPDWFERGHDTLQVHVQFSAIDHLTMQGWIPTVPLNVALSARANRRILARIATDGFELSFTCSDSLTAGHISSFRVTESGSDEGDRAFVSRLDERRFTSLPGTHEGTFYERA